MVMLQILSDTIIIIKFIIQDRFLTWLNITQKLPLIQFYKITYEHMQGTNWFVQLTI